MNSSAVTLPLPRRPVPIIPNGRLGTLLLVGSETVLFACFISAYMVLRMSAPAWPPTGTPVLQLGLSVFNTAVLLMSSVTVFLFSRGQAKHWLIATLALGTAFLFLQGVEFHRLYARGLTLQSGPYGAVFYSLITLHGLHVLGGLGFLSYLMKGNTQVAERSGHTALYWYFVTAVWLVLFSILYIA